MDDFDQNEFASANTNNRQTFGDFSSKKIAAEVRGILIGSLGIRKFILRLSTPGVIMLLVTVLNYGFGDSPGRSLGSSRASFICPRELRISIIPMRSTKTLFFIEYLVYARTFSHLPQRKF